MQHLALLAFDKERCKPFFDRLTELFRDHHSQVRTLKDMRNYSIESQTTTNDMLDMVDDWMGIGSGSGEKRLLEKSN